MKKLFFKYFISIFAVTVLALGLQNGLLLAKYGQSQKEWRNVVYNDFVDNLAGNLLMCDFPDFTVDSISLFSPALTDSRVSGFLVKDPEGRIAFTVGQTTEGIVLSTLAPQNMLIADNGKAVTAKANDTILNIHFRYGMVSIDRIDNSGEKKNYFIPNGVAADDVIGTVTVMFEGQTLSSIDVLSYSPRTYKYSKDIINNCFHSIVIAVPICLLLAFVFAWIISSKNTKYIDSIRKALNDLADGKKDVKLKPNKNSSLNEITVAVNELDKNLQANEKSRQAWLTSISHDLNTPATAMKMIVDGLNDGIFKPNKTTLRDLQNENNVLCDRIGKVIDFSTLQAETKPEVAEFDSKTLFEEIPNLTINCTANTIKCDKVLMNRAVKELVNNALAASGKAELTIGKDDNNYFVQVKNEGKLPDGVKPENLFEPWAKGDSSRSTSGNGLGLPIAGTIAKLHNGSADILEKDDCVIAEIIWPL